MDVPSFIAALVYGVFLIVGAALIRIDVQEHRLPNRIVIPSTVVLVVLVAAHAVASGRLAVLGEAVAGGVLLGGFYLCLRIANPDGLGGGDVKLAVLVGVFLGWHGWAALVVGAASAFVIGAVWAFALLVTHRAGRDERIAFGPWMMIGAWAGLLVI